MPTTVTTRVGISPFATKQHIGVYRSFLVNAFIARYFGGKMLLRIDDTNPLHLADVDSLIDDLTQVVQSMPIGTVGITYVGSESIPAILESQRSSLYREYLKILQEKDFLIYKGQAAYFNVQKYIDLHGDQIELPYQSKPRRTGLISKSLPQLQFPIAINGGQRFLWHFTSVVDDKVLGVTHVVRAKDKIDNQVPQTILNHALGFPSPQYFYTKIMLSSQLLPKVDHLRLMGISPQAIRSYLYGTVTGKAEKIYPSFDAALADFSPSSVTPGQFYFDLPKVLSIQKHLFKYPQPPH